MEKKSQYKGFTPAQAKAHKKYMADFVELRDETSRRLGLNPVSGERLEQDSTRPK